jgi:hypothetical protein
MVDRGENEDKDKDVIFYSKPHNEKTPHLTINATKNGNDCYIDTMSKHAASTIKMHDFLHHLITKHGIRFGSEHFSEGGKKVFDKLGEMPGIKMQHYKDGKQINSTSPYSDDRTTNDNVATHVVASKA